MARTPPAPGIILGGKCKTLDMHDKSIPLGSSRSEFPEQVMLATDKASTCPIQGIANPTLIPSEDQASVDATVPHAPDNSGSTAEDPDHERPVVVPA